MVLLETTVMFTGIVETTGTVKRIEKSLSNLDFIIESSISGFLKIDQSLSHNGVCLTIVACSAQEHRVTAVAETLSRTNLGQWKEGDLVNLERCLPMGGRLDGHMVQGHVDAIGHCVSIEESGGSWRFTFKHNADKSNLLVDKGSVCVNGVSLTVVDPHEDQFSVAIIPYTWEHTTFHRLCTGDPVNLEYDIVGKYIARHLEAYRGKV